MHKFSLAGLSAAGLLFLGLGAAGAMQPASNGDLKNCMGLYVANTACADTKVLCTGTSPVTGQCQINSAQYDDPCNTDLSGPSDNYGCNTPDPGVGCTPGSASCITWVSAHCNFYNASGDLICDDTYDPAPMKSGQKTTCSSK